MDGLTVTDVTLIDSSLIVIGNSKFFYGNNWNLSNINCVLANKLESQLVKFIIYIKFINLNYLLIINLFNLDKFEYFLT